MQQLIFSPNLFQFITNHQGITHSRKALDADSVVKKPQKQYENYQPEEMGLQQVVYRLLF
jgi:hypothetical protein